MFRRTLLALMLAAGCVQTWAGLQRIGLAGDGAYCLRVMLSTGLAACLEPSREATQILLEAPTLIALRSGVADTTALAVIYGLTLQLVPLLLASACFLVPPPAQRDFFAFPVATYFAGGASVVSMGLIEGPTATFLFWLLFYRLLFPPGRTGGWVLAIALAALVPFVHEAMAFLSPLLAAACWWQARRTGSPRLRRGMRLFAAWFVLAALIEAGHAIVPHNPLNRAGFVEGLLRLRWIASDGGIGVPVLLGFAAIAAVLAAWRWQRAAGPVVATFAALASVLAVGAWFAPALRAPVPLFFARNHAAFLSVPLAALALQRAMAGGPALPELPRRAGLRVLALLAAASLSVQLALAADWERYLRRFTAALRAGSGLIAWEQVLASLPPAEAALFWRMNWGWTSPDLSLLLAPRGQVRSIILDPAPRAGVPPPWRPWNPALPATWPKGRMFDIRLGPG